MFKLFNRKKSKSVSIRYSRNKDIRVWYLNGLIHREKGPAVVWKNGTKKWYKNGQLHREDGPAIYWSDIKRYEWYFNGKLHREDGPAIEWYNNGDKHWYRFGKLHRNTGPALIERTSTQCYKKWYKNGLLHNFYGPAIVIEGHILPVVIENWYINGKVLNKSNHPFIIFAKRYNLCENIKKWPEEYRLLYEVSKRDF